jgi:hypothetical protein
VVHSAADENAVGELCDLHSQDGLEMSVVAHGSVERKEILDKVRHMGRSQNVANEQIGGSGVDEIHSVVVARDVHVAIAVSPKSAGERREVGKCLRETALEESDEGFDGNGRASEEAALLNIVDREHGEV